LNQIQTEGGLKSMSRKHIHFATGKYGEQQVISGMRKNCNILIYIDMKLAMDDGIDFFMSNNGVVLSTGNEQGIISTKYFKKIVDIDGMRQNIHTILICKEIYVIYKVHTRYKKQIKNIDKY
jgi:2'-phosphotransferase